MSRPHIVVLHRWRDRYARYDEYVDHDQCAVTYVTTDTGVEGVPAGAAEIAVTTMIDDAAQVAEHIERLAGRFGAPAAVVALKEDDLLTAAVLGRRWDCPGRTPQQLLPFRDKLVMAQQVAAAGLAVPATAAAPAPAAVRAHGGVHGWPVVVKPRVGSSSEGVRIIPGPDQAGALRFDPETPMLVQAHDSGVIHHVDGVFDGTRLGTWRVSRYVDTCLAFRDGSPLGSVEQDDPRLRAAVEVFTTAVLRALTDTPTVFHLEVFIDPGTMRCTFLEIGARGGGAEIPFTWREVHGYDLMRAAFGIALGRAPQIPAPDSFGAECAGWLLVPAPAQRPCQITEATSLVGGADGPYAESIPHAGDVLPAGDAYYEHVGARYRFRGPDSATVTSAVLAAASQVRVLGAPHVADTVDSLR